MDMAKTKKTLMLQEISIHDKSQKSKKKMIKKAGAVPAFYPIADFNSA